MGAQQKSFIRTETYRKEKRIMTDTIMDLESLEDQMHEYQKKINLARSDKDAVIALSNQEIALNNAKILALREETHQLHTRLQARITADEKIIEQAFDNNASHLIQQVIASKATPDRKQELSLRNTRIRSADGKHQNFLKNKTGLDAVQVLDQFLADAKKKLNKEYNKTAAKEAQLRDIKEAYNTLVKEASFGEEMQKGLNKRAVRLSALENKLDLAKRRSAEALEINNIYKQILEFLEKQGANYPNELSALELKIRQSLKELKGFRVIFEKANKAKDEAKATEVQVAMQRERNEAQLVKKREEAVKVARDARKENAKRPAVTFATSESPANMKPIGGPGGGAAGAPRSILSRTSGYTNDTEIESFEDNAKIA